MSLYISMHIYSLCHFFVVVVSFLVCFAYALLGFYARANVSYEALWSFGVSQPRDQTNDVHPKTWHFLPATIKRHEKLKNSHINQIPNVFLVNFTTATKRNQIKNLSFISISSSFMCGCTKHPSIYTNLYSFIGLATLYGSPHWLIF